MMPGQLLRVREDVEWQAYHAIRRHVLFDLRGLSGYDEKHPDEERDGHTPLLFFWKGGPVGTARLDQDNDGDTGIVRLVAIAPDYQRQGIGTEMIRAIERLAAEKGIRELKVNAAENAVIFYEKLGWSIVDADTTNPLMLKRIS